MSGASPATQSVLSPFPGTCSLLERSTSTKRPTSFHRRCSTERPPSRFERQRENCETTPFARLAVLPGDVRHLRTLVHLALDDNWQASSSHRATVGSALRELHSRLSSSDDEFGHRVFYESLRFAAALECCGVEDRNALLDHVVLLKILPRIHGSRRRAEPVLKRLAAFAADPDGATDLGAGDVEAPVLPMTMSKVRRMLRAVEINQYVSFTD